MERLSMNGAEMNTCRAAVAPLAAALLLLTRQAFDSAAAIPDASIEATSSISSSARREALSAAPARRELTEPRVARTLGAVGGISSSSARRGVLVEAARTHTLWGEAQRACLEAATSIFSRSQRARALEALERGGR